MKKFVLILFICLANMRGIAQHNTNGEKVHIIPEPVSLQINTGRFLLNNKTQIISTTNQTADMAALVKEMLEGPTGFNLRVVNKNAEKADNAIILKLNNRPNTVLGEAGYTLEISQGKVLIVANKTNGLFSAIQTLMQLLPPEIESKTATKAVKWEIPFVNILDYPRFGWRGLMLDVSRNFFSKEFVKKYIDEMVKYKFNVFHWHLTDDQGWRIEIKSLPALTEIGAWRVPRTGRWGTFEGPEPNEKPTYGGYYSHEDIREIVAYAQKRFVTIVPEIDVPAHSMPITRCYPASSCTNSANGVLCVASDSTWLVLEKIFTEVAALFPGEYIHVGGDEAFKGFWKDHPKDQELMKKEGIKSLEGLQSYFEKKLEKIITAKGKKMIGWDEILEGGMAPESAVMSWRGMQGGAEAAKMGHYVVMTPTSHCYLDYCQGEPLLEPASGARLRLSTCYEFEPVPDDVDPKFILGGQGNLWTEFVPSWRHAEYMTWPRSLALAEVFWSPKNKRNWPDFIRRTEARFKYMDVANVKYARSAFDAIITSVKGADSLLRVKLDTEIPGLDIYYTFDGTNPDNFYPKYEGAPVVIPKGASEIRVITYREGQPIGREINCSLKEVANRLEKTL